MKSIYAHIATIYAHSLSQIFLPREVPRKPVCLSLSDRGYAWLKPVSPHPSSSLLMAGVSRGKCPLFQFFCAVLTQEKMPITTYLAAALTDTLGRNPILLWVWIYCLGFRNERKITRNPSLPLSYNLAPVETLGPTGTFQIRKIGSVTPFIHHHCCYCCQGEEVSVAFSENHRKFEAGKGHMAVILSNPMLRKATQCSLPRTMSRWLLNVASFSANGAHWKEPGSVAFALSLNVFINIDNVFPECNGCMQIVSSSTKT